MRILLVTLGILLLNAQKLSADDSSKLKFSAYLEAYYGYDLNEPSDHRRPFFLYSYNRNNEVNINLAYIKASYKDSMMRGNLAIMSGTYANSNLASETPLNRMLFEANGGFRLSRKHNLWLDAGVLPSHIGFESPVGKESWNLSRSIAAENSPYYEAGARVSYTNRSGRLYLAALYLNGWQRMQRFSGYNFPSFGTQLTYKGKIFTFNYSTFIGSLYPDEQRRMRYFNNLYAIWEKGRFGFTAGLDFGMEQKIRYSNDYITWYTPVAIGRIKLGNNSALALRLEYYSDPSHIILHTLAPHGDPLMSSSLNFDRVIGQKLLWRTEARMFKYGAAIFQKNEKSVSEYYMLTTALAFSF